jgi:hypothetical protein
MVIYVSLSGFIFLTKILIMKKIILSTVVALFTVAAFAYVAPPPGEHYCKNNPNSNTGICTVSNTTGIADCVTLTGNSTNKDCYGAVNN